MKLRQSYTRRWGRPSQAPIAMLCAALIVTGSPPCHAQAADSGADSGDSTARISNEQLDSLVAPIALYPDPLLAQVLAASTYPLEIVQLQQWLEKNKGLKGQALVDAAEKQPWDSSVQAMAPLPDLVKRLADDIQWTTDLGNAFLAQQNDVMDAVQRMRQKAQANGNLQSTEQQKVETKVIESKSVVVIEPADPQVVYVPSYNPTVVYGAPPPAYPYPPIYYPPVGYYAAGMALSFGIGVAMGAAWGGGWGSCGWGGNNNVTINNNNNFNRNSVNRGGDRTNVGGGGKWQHNPQHRGGAPYGDRATANKFGGNARGDSLSKRQAGARQQVGRQGGNLSSTREAGRGGGRGGGPSQGAGGGRAGGPSQGAGGGRASSPSQGMGGGRAGSPSQGTGGSRTGGPSQGAGSRGASGPNRVGGQDMSRGAGGRSDGFGGGRGGYSGSSARAASNRGASSMGSRGGGGGGRGGGGGGGRGGGGGGGRRR